MVIAANGVVILYSQNSLSCRFFFFFDRLLLVGLCLYFYRSLLDKFWLRNEYIYFFLFSNCINLSLRLSIWLVYIFLGGYRLNNTWGCWTVRLYPFAEHNKQNFSSWYRTIYIILQKWWASIWIIFPHFQILTLTVRMSTTVSMVRYRRIRT